MAILNFAVQHYVATYVLLPVDTVLVEVRDGVLLVGCSVAASVGLGLPVASAVLSLLVVLSPVG